MAGSQGNIAFAIGVALASMAEQHRGTPRGLHAEELLAKHKASTAAQTLTHAGVTYPDPAGEA